MILVISLTYLQLLEIRFVNENEACWINSPLNYQLEN